MARIFLSEGETYGTIGPFSATDVIGTNGNETVYVAGNGNAIFDPSFNRGGDEIIIDGDAATFEGARSGSSFLVTGGIGAQIVIPVGAGGTTLTFDDGSFTLLFDGTNVLLGAQVITASPETLDDLESMPALSASFEGPPADTTPPVDSNVLNLG
ncbi:MAG: hypothetical protein H6917_17170 [Novosphingobium sp.]|nr:hypothetical protein [Novosphingobium sp.]MCP5404105.1 hypothetical protein [Novosphingobium sp.]